MECEGIGVLKEGQGYGGTLGCEGMGGAQEGCKCMGDTGVGVKMYGVVECEGIGVLRGTGIWEDIGG